MKDNDLRLPADEVDPPALDGGEPIPDEELDAASGAFASSGSTTSPRAGANYATHATCSKCGRRYTLVFGRDSTRLCSRCQGSSIR